MTPESSIAVKREYIAGFDYLKLFGCIFVAFCHIVFIRVAVSMGIHDYQFFTELITVYYMAAGYLLCDSLQVKDRPYRYIAKYVTKYLIPYSVIVVINVFCFCVGTLNGQGIYMIGDLLLRMSKELITAQLVRVVSVPEHLWFIPPLLVAIAVNGIMQIRQKPRALAILAMIVAGLVYIITFWDGYLVKIAPWLYAPGKINIVCIAFSRYGEALFGVWCGTLLYKYRDRLHKIKSWPILIAALLAMALEMFLYYRADTHNVNLHVINVSMTLFSFLITKAILSVKSTALQKRHREITIFAGITYFLHVNEYWIYFGFIADRYAVFGLVILTNIILTLMICLVLKLKGIKAK